MKERNRLEQKIGAIRTLENSLNDNVEMIALAEEEGDEGVLGESEAALTNLHKKAEKLQLESLLSGEMDSKEAYLEVHAGSGGTEAQDWAEMLLRMYVRWGESHGHKITVLERSNGEEAGIKSATIQIGGPDVYGWMKTENGVHRLVRISPYDSSARRHTSFASVSVSPVIDEEINIELEEKDLIFLNFLSLLR
jgi:peptide chain release factor 2